MAGAQFEYDEKGTTFYYFLISFFGIVLAPVTYYVLKITKLPGKQKNVLLASIQATVNFLYFTQLFANDLPFRRFFHPVLTILVLTFQMIRKEPLRYVDVHPAQKSESFYEKRNRNQKVFAMRGEFIYHSHISLVRSDVYCSPEIDVLPDSQK